MRAETIVRNNEEMRRFAGEFLSSLDQSAERATVICLNGELGSGKTTFVKACAKILGVAENVISPTFLILKTFATKHKKYKLLHHIDAYRLISEKELEALGWREMLDDSRNLIFVEWASEVRKIMPEESIELNFKFIDEETRSIEEISPSSSSGW